MLAGLELAIPTIGNGAGSTTDTATLYIAGAPTGITPSNLAHSLYVATGRSRFGGAVQFELSYHEKLATASISGGSLTIDPNTASVFRVSRNANITSFTISAPNSTGSTASAMSFTVLFDATTGAGTVAWPSSVRWAGGTAPTMTNTNGRTDIISFLWCSTGSVWYGFVGGLNFTTT